VSWKLSRTVLRGAVGGNADCLLDKRLDEKTKQPYAFTLNSRQPFAFAGLWDAWREPAGEDWLQSFAIFTTEPNELAATVHNRMPVILQPSEYDRWLTRDEAERPPIDLLRPYDAGEMTAYPVDPPPHTSSSQMFWICLAG